MNTKSSFIAIGIFLIAITLFSCSDKKKIEVRDKAGKISESYQINRKSGKKEGLYKHFYPNGKLNEEATYKDGMLDGYRKLYREDGSLEIHENYLSGAFQGEFTSYYPNGKLNVIGKYLNNEMTGLWKRYYDSGELMEETLFSENEENGPFKEYYKNGKIKTEGTYLNGPHEHGELRMYDENGIIVKKMNCDNGVCHTIWESKEPAK